ncbi:hypothetical protein AAF712_011399 [Marasmius tenuissimus]|uniref:Uncharacterized protein n=1 Tax=Marasmius tenuissimus TaxID=585030 RepID=A0ABR2ZLZ2_9AGAR
MSVLEDDVVANARTLIRDCRSSSERRLSFKKTLIDGNAAGGFGDPKVLLRVITLLRDCTTRWSSTFFMLDHLLEIYYTDRFICNYYPEDITMLCDIQLRVLADIREVLHYPHSIQESVSAERTLTLHLVVPLYEELLDILKSLKSKFPKLSHALDAAILKLNDYIKIARESKIYGLAIVISVIHPMFKLTHIRERWGDEEAVKVKAYLREAMLAFQRKQPFEPNAASPFTCRAEAGQGQEGLQALKHGLEDGNTGATAQPTNTAKSENSGPSTADRDAWDQAEVDKQLLDWENTGIFDEDDDFDLVRRWDMPV